MIPTSRQSYSLALSHRLIAECAKFCDENLIRHQGIDETIMSIVACQSTLIAMLANHRHGDTLRVKIAESMVDGTAADYIADMQNPTKGPH